MKGPELLRCASLRPPPPLVPQMFGFICYIQVFFCLDLLGFARLVFLCFYVFSCVLFSIFRFSWFFIGSAKVFFVLYTFLLVPLNKSFFARQINGFVWPFMLCVVNKPSLSLGDSMVFRSRSMILHSRSVVLYCKILVCFINRWFA